MLRAEFPSTLKAFDKDDDWTQMKEPEGPDDITLTLVDCANIARENALLDLRSLFISSTLRSKTPLKGSHVETDRVPFNF